MLLCSFFCFVALRRGMFLVPTAKNFEFVAKGKLTARECKAESSWIIETTSNKDLSTFFILFQGAFQ